MKIFSIAVNHHDHNTYNGLVHNQIERHTRVKHNLNPDFLRDPVPCRDFFDDHFLPNYNKEQVFAFTISNLGHEYVEDLVEETLPDTDFLKFKPNNLWDRLHTDSYYYIDHHQSHAAYAFLNSGFKESDVLAIDDKGYNFNCIFINKHGTITDLTKELSIGGCWNTLAQNLGFEFLQAGKVMGLVGFGKYNDEVYTMIHRYLENPNQRLPDGAHDIIQRVAKEDVAFTLQQVTFELVTKHVYPLKTSDNLCIAGGVAYNGYMNEEFTKHYTNVHVPPAPGDEGQALGVYMHADYILNGNTHIPTVYAGEDYIVDTAIFNGLYYQQKSMEEVYTEVAAAIADGAIVGWYQGASESGHRALGNRSILADPRKPDIKDIINSKIKLREDFRPFAPSVLYEHYQDYFDTNQPSPYMSRIMPVTSNTIPGVTHVDGTARIQTVQREFNSCYYDLINAFYTLTGVPMLLNTSFNCQEPIVETPEDAVATFKKCGLDVLIINNYVIRKEDGKKVHI